MRVPYWPSITHCAHDRMMSFSRLSTLTIWETWALFSKSTKLKRSKCLPINSASSPPPSIKNWKALTFNRIPSVRRLKVVSCFRWIILWCLIQWGHPWGSRGCSRGSETARPTPWRRWARSWSISWTNRLLLIRTHHLDRFYSKTRNRARTTIRTISLRCNSCSSSKCRRRTS